MSKNLQVYGFKSFKNFTVLISLLGEQETKVELSLGWVCGGFLNMGLIKSTGFFGYVQRQFLGPA